MLLPYGARLKVTLGQPISHGEELTEGSIDPKELLKVKDIQQFKNTYYMKYKKYTVCKG